VWESNRTADAQRELGSSYSLIEKPQITDHRTVRAPSFWRLQRLEDRGQKGLQIFSRQTAMDVGTREGKCTRVDQWHRGMGLEGWMKSCPIGKDWEFTTPICQTGVC